MQSTPYTLPILASGLVALGTAAFVARRRAGTPAAREFIAIALAVALMCLAYAAELSSATLPMKLLWLDVRWVGICATPVAALALVLRWDGRTRWLQPRRLALLCVLPALTLVLAWLDPVVGIIDGPSTLLVREGFVLRGAQAHAGFWVFAAYAYACNLVMAWVLLRAMWSSPIRRNQALVLLVATITSWVGNAVYVLGYSPDPGFDTSHLGYGLACLTWAWGLQRVGLFDLVPVARDRVFESLADAVLVLDAERRVVDHNPAATKLVGATELLGTSLARLVGEALATQLWESKQVHLLGRVLSVERATVREAGRSATVLTLRDVTLQRQAEAAREEALRQAEDSARVRTEFLTRMSHEVRGPLHGIVGATDLLRSSALATEPRRYAEAVAASSRVLLALVDELLDFSKLDADRLVVTAHALDARASVDEVASLFSGAAEKKGLALRVDAPPRLPATADPLRLRQVLVNLVGNAVKFTDRGTITVRALQERDGWRLGVSDTGIGIAGEAQQRIFEPFVQVGVAPRDAPAGTGLGLSIARRLCELMGGALTVESRPGEGSTFWFTLPGPRAEPPRPASAPARAAAGGGQRGRVLVVDDQEVNRLVTSALLEREGCQVEAVADAAAALRVLERGEVALLLTDLRMPGVDGLQLMRTVRALKGPAAQTPIIALSGDVHETVRAEALAAGADDWLAKPADAQKLQRALDLWLPGATGPALPPTRWERVHAVFRESAPADVEALLRAASLDHWEQVRALAHALKGACDVVGARALSTLCAQLEHAGPGSRAVLAQLEPTVAQTLTNLPAPVEPSA